MNIGIGGVYMTPTYISHPIILQNEVPRSLYTKNREASTYFTKLRATFKMVQLLLIHMYNSFGDLSSAESNDKYAICGSEFQECATLF